jgi:hypothetical protein
MGFRARRRRGADEPGRGTNVSYVTPGFIEALRLPIVEGRSFTESDHSNSQPVVIVNEEFVRRFYKDQDVVGLHLKVALRPGDAPRLIVGVVGNARATSSGLGGDGSPLIEPFVVTFRHADGRRFLHARAYRFSPSWVVCSSGPVAGVSGDPSVDRASIRCCRSRRWKAWLTCRPTRCARNGS